MKKAGVQMLFLNDTIATSVALDQAMSTAGWYPKIQISPPQDYDTSFLTTGASVAKNYYVYMPSEPLEAASAVPAVTQYEQIVPKYVPTAHLGFFGEMAFGSWLLFCRVGQGLRLEPDQDLPGARGGQADQLDCRRPAGNHKPGLEQGERLLHHHEDRERQVRPGDPVEARSVLLQPGERADRQAVGTGPSADAVRSS